MITYFDTDGKYLRRISESVTIDVDPGETAIEGRYGEEHYLPGGETVPQLRPKFVLTASINGAPDDIETLTPLRDDVVRVDNIPVGTLVEYDGYVEIVNDGFIEWSSFTSGEMEFHLSNFPYLETIVYADVANA